MEDAQLKKEAKALMEYLAKKRKLTPMEAMEVMGHVICGTAHMIREGLLRKD